MKHKKGFAAVLLTLIISALLSVSAFAASDRFSDVPEASPFYGAPMGNDALPGL